MGKRTEVLTVSAVSKWLQLSSSVVYRMVSRGELPHLRIGRSVRFRREDIDAYLAAQVQGGPDGVTTPAAEASGGDGGDA